MKYKRHPNFKEITVSEDGTKVKSNNIPLTVKEIFPKPNNPLMVVAMYDSYFSLPKLVLETYKGFPKDNKRYFARCIDKNHKNTHPNNLKWSLSNRTEESKIASAMVSSKLTLEQCFDCYYSEDKTLRQLALKYNVSDMTIHRAIKRVKRLLKLV